MRLTTHGFTTGVMNPELALRFDVEKRNRGASDIRNMTVAPIGPARRRPGFRHVTTLIASPTADDRVRLTPFAFNRDQQYVHVWTHEQVRVIHLDAVVATLATPYTRAQLRDFTYTQSGDIVLVAHPSHTFRRLRREGAHGTWTLTAPTLTWSANQDPGSPPGAVTLFAGRCYIGGFFDKPNLMFGSRSSDIYNFTEGDLDDEAFQIEMLEDRVNRIVHFVPERNLTILTSGTPIGLTAQPITPSDIGRQTQPGPGSSEVRPARVDNRTMYITLADRDDQPQTLMEFTWDDLAQGFVTADLGLLAPHLLSKPVDMTALPTLQGSRAELAVVAQADGTAAVLASNRDQEVTAWSWWDTHGPEGRDLILSTATVSGRLYAAIRRRRPGGDIVTLEVLDEGHELDASVRATGNGLTSLSGLDHLEGVTVDLVCDGAPAGTATVASGSVTLPAPADTVEAGLGIAAHVDLLPPEMLLRDGSTHGLVKRINRIGIATRHCRAVRVGTQRKSPRRADSDSFDLKIAGEADIAWYRLLGWKRAQAPRIHIDGPGTILGATMEVQA